MNEVVEEPDLSHIHWSWPEAIAANPARSLATADLAMDYFAYSPFFDTKSNNSVLRTQRRVENPGYGHAEEKYLEATGEGRPVLTHSELNAFRSGFEYIVSHALPPRLFLIQRRDVSEDGSRENNVRGCYFILDEKVYPTPTVYEVMSTRLKNASHLISSTFRTLSEAHPPSNPRAQSSWRSLPPSSSTTLNAEASTSRVGAAATTYAQASGPDGDISMDGTPAPLADAASAAAPVDAATLGATSSNAKEEASAESSTPDYHLYNALASTRAALSSLQEISRTPAASIDPKDELRALEAQLLGSSGAANSDKGRAGARSVAAGSSTLQPRIRTWNDSSLSNTPTGARVAASSVVVGPGMTPRGMASTPGMSPSTRA